jgi:class 3 adenylate cyclase
MDKTPDAAAPGRERRRRLRAVFAADAANFGGLVSVDETKTLDSLWTTRRIATQELGKHGGWLFGMPGDGIFALFESAVDAVRCALDIQARIAAQPAASVLHLRMGIHLGEVLFQDELPFGEALVIAARLESLAEPGGILVSQSVMEAVAPRIQATFVDQGVRSLKHSPRQIKTYIVLPQPPREETPSEPQPEPLDLTLVPNVRTTTPAEAVTVRGPVRLATSGENGAPIVESRPLPLLPRDSDPDPAQMGEAPPALPTIAEPTLPERTVFLPGRRVAPEPTEAARAAPAGPVPGEAPHSPQEEPAQAAADIAAVPSRATPADDGEGAIPGSEDPAVLLQDPRAPDGDADREVLPAPDFDPDRTIVLPRRPLDTNWPVKPLPKASPFNVSAPEPAPAPARSPAAGLPDPAGRESVQAAIPDIVQALTAYLGPIARVLVKRNAEACSSPQALIEAVAAEIPAEAERQAFRERAGALVSRRT